MLVFDVACQHSKTHLKPQPMWLLHQVDSQKTESGLAYKVLTPGSGDAKPAGTSVVRVHYSGWTTDGKMFDSSVMRGRPATFPLNGVIAGWTEGVQLMKVGESTLLDPRRDGIQRPSGAPQGMLVFDVELFWRNC